MAMTTEVPVLPSNQKILRMEAIPFHTEDFFLS